MGGARCDVVDLGERIRVGDTYYHVVTLSDGKRGVVAGTTRTFKFTPYTLHDPVAVLDRPGGDRQFSLAAGERVVITKELTVGSAAWLWIRDEHGREGHIPGSTRVRRLTEPRASELSVEVASFVLIGHLVMPCIVVAVGIAILVSNHRHPSGNAAGVAVIDAIACLFLVSAAGWVLFSPTRIVLHAGGMVIRRPLGRRAIAWADISISANVEVSGAWFARRTRHTLVIEFAPGPAITLFRGNHLPSTLARLASTANALRAAATKGAMSGRGRPSVGARSST